MKVTRIIHPIGQGGFYTETHTNGNQTKTFVYDCGGFNHGQKKMESYLESYLDPKSGEKEIEAVFISHFHADHINGLQYLLDNSKVKYLFLPQLTEEAFIEAYVYNFYQMGPYSQVNRFMSDLYRRLNSDDNNEGRPRIIQIEEANDSRFPDKFDIEEQTDDDLSIRALNRNHPDLDLLRQNHIPSGTVLYSG